LVNMSGYLGDAAIAWLGVDNMKMVALGSKKEMACWSVTRFIDPRLERGQKREGSFGSDRANLLQPVQ
ncbi:MAG: hypothetical protein ABID54_13675, partial [Pseudomonadota bacterium]